MVRTKRLYQKMKTANQKMVITVFTLASKRCSRNCGITVTGTANHASATVAGNVTGKALTVGNNTISIIVTVEDGATTKTYTITVIRAASDDATLNSLIVSSGVLSPAFDANVTDYTVNVANNVNTITVSRCIR